jgi:hypothetical protein
MRWKFAPAVTGLALIALSACQTTESTQQAPANDDLQRLTGDEILAVIANKTLLYGDGGDFYAADGSFTGLWKGQSAAGTWWVENDVRCYDVEEWGGEWCHEFYWEGDTLVLARQGEDKMLRGVQLLDGNQLDD